MPYVGFETTIPGSERAKTVHALDRSATVTGTMNSYVPNISNNFRKSEDIRKKYLFLRTMVLLNWITEEVSHFIYLGSNVYYKADFEINDKSYWCRGIYGTEQATRKERQQISNLTN
jgi:hypothetical protein